MNLYWIPLGAGGHSVRLNGRVYEAVEAARQHRQRYDLYHAALTIELEGDSVPTPVWGRDELTAGEMWNSNSVVAWLIASAGLPTETLRPPPHGRAPGWLPGLAVARRGGYAASALRVRLVN